MRRVGLLMWYPEGDVEGQASAAAFQRRLQELGWTEGRNVQIDSLGWRRPQQGADLR
jgi:hypothetical protein